MVSLRQSLLCNPPSQTGVDTYRELITFFIWSSWCSYWISSGYPVIIPFPLNQSQIDLAVCSALYEGIKKNWLSGSRKSSIGAGTGERSAGREETVDWGEISTSFSKFLKSICLLINLIQSISQRTINSQEISLMANHQEKKNTSSLYEKTKSLEKMNKQNPHIKNERSHIS